MRLIVTPVWKRPSVFLLIYWFRPTKQSNLFNGHLAKRQLLNLTVVPCRSLLLLFGSLCVKRTSLAEKAGPKGVYLRESYATFMDHLCLNTTSQWLIHMRKCPTISVDWPNIHSVSKTSHTETNFLKSKDGWYLPRELLTWNESAWRESIN